jgi:hypothetical protein
VLEEYYVRNAIFVCTVEYRHKVQIYLEYHSACPLVQIGRSQSGRVASNPNTLSTLWVQIYLEGGRSICILRNSQPRRRYLLNMLVKGNAKRISVKIFKEDFKASSHCFLNSFTTKAIIISVTRSPWGRRKTKRWIFLAKKAACGTFSTDVAPPPFESWQLQALKGGATEAHLNYCFFY